MANPAKPKHIKEAQGTLRPCREVDSPMTHAPLVKVPKIPPEVSESGKPYFKFACDALIANGLLTAAFIPSIVRAANWYSIYVNACKQAAGVGYYQETDNGYTAVTAHLTAMEKAHKYLTEFDNQYGLNLVASQKISVPEKREDDFD